MEEKVTISCEEYKKLIIDSARLLFIKSYVEKENYLSKETLARWFENWSE